MTEPTTPEPDPTPVVIDITRTSHVPQLIVGGVVYEREEGL